MRSGQVQPDIRRRIRRRATRLVIAALCGELRQGRFGVLTGLGFSRTQISAFQQLRLQDLHRLGLRDCDWLDISVDHARLEHVLRALLNNTDEECVINIMIQRGASQEMMAALFGLTSNDVVARRRAMGLPEKVGGRYRLPTRRERSAIVDRWFHLGYEEPCPRRRFLRLAEAFDWPLAALWRTIQQSESLLVDGTENGGLEGQPLSVATPTSHE